MSTGITYDISANTSGATTAIKRFRSGLGAVAGAASKVLAPIAAITGAAGLLGTAMASIGKAAELETLETAFIPLLGGAKAAKERIAELSKFAASTPFDIPGVASASKILETLTHGALSTGKGLTLVGDAASGAGVPFEQMATTVGRLYDGLQSGRGAGEAMARLQELGALSGDARSEIEALSAAGKNTEAWEKAQAAMGRFSGSMDLQSGTWNGLLSTLQDNIGQSLAAFGDPIMDAIKPFLGDIIDTVGSLTKSAAAFGAKVAAVIQFLVAAFSSGQIGDILGASLILSFQKSVNFLWAALQGIGAAVGQMFVETGRSFASILSIVTQPAFWSGIGDLLKSFAIAFGASLMDSLNDIQGGFMKILRFFGADKLADSMQGSLQAREKSAAALHDKADALRTQGSDKITPFIEQHAAKLKASLAAISKAYTDTVASTPDAIDTSTQETVLNNALGKVFATIDKAKAKAAAAAIPPPAAITPTLPTSAISNPQSAIASDRLAQIGGFVGGAAPSTRTAEDTAKHTERTAKATEKISDLIMRTPSAIDATF